MENILADYWDKLSQLTILSPDGHLCLLLEEDPAVKSSSRVGRRVEGAGGTTEGVEGLLDLLIIFSVEYFTFSHKPGSVTLTQVKTWNLNSQGDP